MKIKSLFFIILIFLAVVSALQIFPLPPFAKNLYPVYESGYFKELRQSQEIVKDSFLNIKIHGRSEAAWFFLKDIKDSYDIDVKIYNRHGQRVTLPRIKEKHVDEDVSAYLKKTSGTIVSDISVNRFSSFLPLKTDNRCAFCHRKTEPGDVIGVMRIDSPFDAHIYYTGERIFIFILILLFIGGLLFLLVKWEPERKIKEMFDKS